MGKNILTFYKKMKSFSKGLHSKKEFASILKETKLLLGNKFFPLREAFFEKGSNYFLVRVISHGTVSYYCNDLAFSVLCFIKRKKKMKYKFIVCLDCKLGCSK